MWSGGTTIKILTVGDLHARDTNPSSRKYDYKQAILAKLMEIRRIANEEKADVTIFLGDIFDQKRGARVSDFLRQQLIKHFMYWPGSALVVPGNHDMGAKGIDSLGNQPLGTLYASGCIRPLTNGETLDNGNTVLIPRPYNEKRDADPTYYSLDEDIDYSGKLTIMFCHGSVLDPGNDRPYDFVSFSDIPNRPDILVTGHIHENLGIVNDDGHLFINTGSIGRNAKTQANLTRKVQVALIDTDTHEARAIDVPVAPAEDVFETSEVSESVEASDKILEYVKRVGEGLRSEELTIDELLAGGDMPREVRALVKRLLEDAA